MLRTTSATAMNKTQKLQAMLQSILGEAGIQINGAQPWDIQVHDERFYARVIRQLSLGLGEAYMDKWWDCEQLDVLFDRLLNINVEKKFKNWHFILRVLPNILFNRQTKTRSLQVAERHYNLGNDLYQAMLGKTMAYTCAYWRGAETLDQAQYQKFDLICRKLSLREGNTVLELGCGWGGFAHYAATHYGCKVVAVNVAVEQVNFAKQLCANLPVEVYLTDYRNHHIYNPKKLHFDKVVSIGLCEHVGYKNYAGFMQLVQQQLKDDGLFLLHTIGSNKTVFYVDPWIDKYIFPNGMLPSIKQLSAASEGVFIMEDWQNFGADYDKTLMAWHDNFVKHWQTDLAQQYDERFYRMWTYYLLSCAGLFRSRQAQLWQIVFSKTGVRGGWQFR